jgi:hypothetical protein
MEELLRIVEEEDINYKVTFIFVEDGQFYCDIKFKYPVLVLILSFPIHFYNMEWQECIKIKNIAEND